MKIKAKYYVEASIIFIAVAMITPVLNLKTATALILLSAMCFLIAYNAKFYGIKRHSTRKETTKEVNPKN